MPLKIKISMWFVHKGVFLTKENLAKRSWHGSKQCCFCDQEETVHHLSLAKLFWRTIHVAFHLAPPMSLSNLFGKWLSIKLRHECMREFLPYFELFGTVGTTVFLTEQRYTTFCRLSTKLQE